MMIALLGLLAALGFWFLIGLVLYVVVGSVRRELDKPPVEMTDYRVLVRQLQQRYDFRDRYELYEKALGPEGARRGTCMVCGQFTTVSVCDRCCE